MGDDDILLALEARHAAAFAESRRSDGNLGESAAVLAEGLAAALSTFRAETLHGAAAKARVIERQAGGRVASIIEHGGIAERLLAASALADLARLVPRRKPLRAKRRTPANGAKASEELVGARSACG